MYKMRAGAAAVRPGDCESTTGRGIVMKIVVLAGGLSPERSVSLSSGAMVAQGVVGDGSLLLDYTYKTDLDERSYNSIKLVRPNESTGRADVFQAVDSANIARWGLLQLYQTVDEALNDAQAAAQAQAMLSYYNRRWRTLKVSALGLPGLRAGQMLMMDVPNLGDINLYALVLLEKVTHTFVHDVHTMDFEVQELGVA